MIIPDIQALRVRRIKQGYSVRSLAAKCGVHYATLATIERPGHGVSPRTAKKIAEALECDFDELFTIKD